MTKPDLIKKLDALLEQLERERAYGSVELEIRGGRASIVRVTKTERLDQGETTHANYEKR
jgi:hypothetical protein